MITIGDVGHGGRDSGAFFFNTKESMLNLRLCLLIKGYMHDGVGQNNIILTRYHDHDLSPIPRRAIIQQPADYFFSVHHNAFHLSSSEGFESFIRSRNPHSKDAQLQRNLHDHLRAILSKWEIKDRGAKEKNFRVLSEKMCPGIFIEVGFMSNLIEYGKMINPIFQAEFALALAQFFRSRPV